LKGSRKLLRKGAKTHLNLIEPVPNWVAETEEALLSMPWLKIRIIKCNYSTTGALNVQADGAASAII
jgi:hypothetical protein